MQIHFLAKIEPKLSISPRHRPIKIKEGEDFHGSCETWEVISGLRKLYRKLKWYKRMPGNDKEMPRTSAGGRAAYGTTYGHKALNLFNVTKSDSATYVCKLFDSIPGEVILERSVDIIVLGESKIFQYNLLK